MSATRLLRQIEVCYEIGVPKSTLYWWISKGTFPRPVKLGARSVGWRYADVEAWKAKRPAACRQAAATA